MQALKNTILTAVQDKNDYLFMNDKDKSEATLFDFSKTKQVVFLRIGDFDKAKNTVKVAGYEAVNAENLMCNLKIDEGNKIQHPLCRRELVRKILFQLLKCKGIRKAFMRLNLLSKRLCLWVKQA